MCKVVGCYQNICMDLYIFFAIVPFNRREESTIFIKMCACLKERAYLRGHKSEKEPLHGVMLISTRELVNCRAACCFLVNQSPKT
jgi:hypothetical protein